ncbi:MAG: exodeoxyribonuclease V subunit gamma [Zoogloeaceae bacterium]|nr:exodeoxyribonuclease V subunit gamma [Zoogloeaceae bacterium]
MLHLHTSNRYEILRARLLEGLAEPPADPFARQEIIVPSAAVQHDLQRALAQTFGIACGQEFSFLATWLWRCIGQLVPDVRRASPFAPEHAVWRLLKQLTNQEDFSRHPRLARYLEAADPVMKLELAQQIAILFETYLTYRPDWLARWRMGKTALPPHASAENHADEQWQMALWQHFAESLATLPRHPADVFFEAMEALGNAGAAHAALPQTAHLFALSSLPPLYLQILVRLARWMDLHLYLVNPCGGYWHELVTQKQQDRQEKAGRALYLDNHYPLLADWGRQTQSLLGMILEADPESLVTHEAFLPPQADCLLARFQRSLLELEPPAAGAWPLAAEDRSVEIHVAHSLFRQLEILRDQLRARFEADPALTPGAVLVALPDIDAAAPLIDAVFGDSGQPYTLTGRRAARENPVARLLLALMDLAAPPARLSASALFAFLQEPLALAALALSEAELDRLQSALEEAGARWGLDAASRAAADLPAMERHTWRDAFARLMLGYAQSPDGPPFQGQLPAGAFSGAEASLLGVFWRVLERLETLVATLAHPRAARDWQALWLDLLGDWLPPENDLAPADADALRLVREKLAALTAAMTEADPDTRHPQEVARAALETALQETPHGGIPGGGITFAPLSSLRHLPYRLICLLDLGDGIFPKPPRTLEFDLTALETRPGDRQRRDDARNLFLDFILAARDGLYLSYTGKSQRDDAPLPPSLLLAELREFLCRATDTAPERLTVTHPLQAFSPAYFSEADKSDSRLVSYRADYALALRQQAQAQPPPPFFAAPLPDKTTSLPALAELQTFFRHPARALLQNLGILLAEAEGMPEDEEPFISNGLTRWQLGERLLPHALAGDEPAALREIARAMPDWPSGQPGVALLDAELVHFLGYVRALRPHLAKRLPETLEFHLTLQAGTSFAQIRNLTPGGLLRYRYARARARDAIAAWLEHLFLHASPHYPEAVTTHFARDLRFDLQPLPAEQAQRYLDDWFAAWREGQSAPLAFYPETAWVWMQEDKARAARDVWDAAHGEGQDRSWRLALRDRFPNPADALSDPRFQHWRETLLGPLMQHFAASQTL